MRDYGRVHTTFWSSPTVQAMSEDARTLALYLLTSPHSTIAGVFRLPDGYACEDLRWDAQRVREGFAELLAKGFANRCETTKWVWIAKHLEWNPPENPNQRKAAARISSAVPDECAWKQAFMRVCGPSLGLEAVLPSNPSATVPQPFLNQEQEQEQEQQQEQEHADPVGSGAVGAEPPAKPLVTDPDEIIFGFGVPVLVKAGNAEKHVRSFLGKLRKEHGDAKVIDTLRACFKAKPLQPLEWLAKALPPKPRIDTEEARRAENERTTAEAAKLLGFNLDQPETIDA